MAQPKYLFIYHSPKSDEAREFSPEAMQQVFARWNVWKSKFQANILSLGDALKPGGKILADGVITDGPFPETKDVVSGYSIVQAESYEAALKVARECPITEMPGAKIEVRELVGFG